MLLVIQVQEEVEEVQVLLVLMEHQVTEVLVEMVRLHQ